MINCMLISSKYIVINVDANAFDTVAGLLSQLCINKIHFVINNAESFEQLLKILKTYQWKNITITYNQYGLYDHYVQLAEIIKSFTIVEKFAIKALHLSVAFLMLYNAIVATLCIKKAKFQMSVNAVRNDVPPARYGLKVIISLVDCTSPRCLKQLYKTNIYGIELTVSEGIAIPNLLEHISKLQQCRQLSIIHRQGKLPLGFVNPPPRNIYCLKLNTNLSEHLFITILGTHIEQIKRCKHDWTSRCIPSTQKILDALSVSTNLQCVGDYLNYDAPVLLKQLLDRNKSLSKRRAQANILDLVIVFNSVLPIYVIVDIFDWLDHYHDCIAPALKVAWALKAKISCDKIKDTTKDII